MEKFPAEKPKRPENKDEQLEKLQAAKEKMEARVEILERHKIIFFDCIEPGSLEKVIYNDENIPEELKKKIREQITLDQSEWIIKGLEWERSSGKDRLEEVNAIVDKNDYPAMDEASGIIIGGSPHMISEQTDWMETLREYIRIAGEKNIPILGICFGHQMIAESFGGKVEKTPQREFGTVQVDLTAEGARDKLFRDLPIKDLDVLTSHNDSVTKINEGVTQSLALNGFNINQAIGVGENIRGVQFHPELYKEILEAISFVRAEAMKSEGLDMEQIVRNLKDAPQARKVLRNFDKYFVFRYSQK